MTVQGLSVVLSQYAVLQIQNSLAVVHTSGPVVSALTGNFGFPGSTPSGGGEGGLTCVNTSP